MRRLFLLLALSLAISFPAAAAEMHFGDNGLDIDAGSLGKFTLTYPQLRNASQQPVHKLLEKHAAGKTATLQYDGGGGITLSLDEAGRVVLKLTGTRQM